MCSPDPSSRLVCRGCYRGNPRVVFSQFQPDEGQAMDACTELFQYAASFVTPADVSAFVPRDPGSPGYDRMFRQILAARAIPARATFDITETVGLTRWVNAKRESDPVPFRRFRVFTNSVALLMSVLGRAHDEEFPPNYTVISLIDDTAALQDEALWKLLHSGFDQAYHVWTDQHSEEAVFGLLGKLLAIAHLGASDRELTLIADELVDQESHCPDRVSGDFVFGCTVFDLLRHRWTVHIADLIRPVSPTLSLIREALLSEYA
jgi:hypothetical protein